MIVAPPSEFLSASGARRRQSFEVRGATSGLALATRRHQRPSAVRVGHEKSFKRRQSFGENERRFMDET